MKKLVFLFVFAALTRASVRSDVDVEWTVGVKRSVSNSKQYTYADEGCFVAGGKVGNYLGNFQSSSNPVDACAQTAWKRNFKEFAVLKGGLCRGGNKLSEAYLNYGTSLTCKNGMGARNAVNAYSIRQVPLCGIESSDKASKACRIQRQQETAQSRKDYELGDPDLYFNLPSLNRTSEEALKILLKDSLEQHWIWLYINSTIYKNLGLFQLFYKGIKNVEFQDAGDYIRAYNFFIQHQLVTVKPSDTKYFRFHFQDASIPFRNLSEMALWRDDNLFTDQRLAGLNPMSIKRISWDPEITGGVDWTLLSKKLNSKFDLEGEVQDVLGIKISLDQAIYQGYLYTVQYPLYDGLTAKSSDPFGSLMEAFSPIAIFASKPGRHAQENKLKPVAIQINSSSDSPVFTPEDSELWLKAKHIFQVADFAHAEVIEHLFKLHLFLEPICVCLHRRLSKLHPVHEMMKHHCRGLIGANKFGYPFLMNPANGSMDKLLTIGRQGAVQMMFRASQEVTWDDTDFLANIKNRGLDDKEKLPYFPYRDDGQLIHDTISNMVNEFVDQYYKSHKEVQQDLELQDFAHDVSLGSGRVRNFPTKITSKWILKKHLTRLIWLLSAQHSVVNYPVEHMGALTPNTPTKLYNDPRVGSEHYGVYNLPRGFTCGAQAALSMTLASLRYDSLFDYADRLQDKKGRNVVRKYYSYLHGYVKSTIEARNLQRFREGHLPYPYLLPGWIANSIHT